MLSSEAIPVPPKARIKTKVVSGTDFSAPKIRIRSLELTKDIAKIKE